MVLKVSRKRRAQAERLSASTIQRLTLIFCEALPFVSKHGMTLTPEESRAMLAAFLESTEPTGRDPTATALNLFVRAGVERFVRGKVDTLDRAFQLAPRRGRQRSSAVFNKRLAIAIEVRQAMRSEKLTRDASIEAVSQRRDEKFEYVRDAYQDLKFEAKVAMSVK